MLRIFEHFNNVTDCPICKTNKDGKAVLVPDYSTEENGNVQCIQIHLDCLDLAIDELYPLGLCGKVLYQFIGDKITKHSNE